MTSSDPASSEITIGIVAPSAEDRELIRGELGALSWVRVGLEVDQYSVAPGDRSVRRFLEARPDVIIVDMEDPRLAIQTLQILHAALPESWLFVTSAANDPDLIIETMRAGAREYLLKPIPPRSLSKALGRYVAERTRHQQREDVGKIYCVTTAKGGAGATSLTINIATSISEVPDTRVGLVDLHGAVGDAAAYLNLNPQYTVADALGAAPRLDTVLLESLMSEARGISVLAGPKEFWPELAPGVTTTPGVSALAKMLEVVAQTFTHTFIDLDSSLDKQQLQLVVEMSAGVVVVLTPELPALWRTQRLFSSLRAHRGSDKLRVVLNRSRKGDEITDGEIQRVLKHPVYWKLPNDYKASIEAINTGSPLVSNNHSQLSNSYRKLALGLTGLSLAKKRRQPLRWFSSNARK